MYDPASPWLGNSILRTKYEERIAADPTNTDFCSSADESDFEIVDWIYGNQMEIDMRMMLVKCVDGRWE